MSTQLLKLNSSTHRMCPNHGMHSLDGFADVSLLIVCHQRLAEAGVRCVKPMKPLPEVLGQILVCSGRGEIECISTRLGRLEAEENGCAHSIAAETDTRQRRTHLTHAWGWECGNLHLVAHIAVPFDAAHVVLDLIINSTSRKVAVHRQQLRETSHLASMLVHVQRPEVFAKIPLGFLSDVREILALEHHHAALGRQ